MQSKYIYKLSPAIKVRGRLHTRCHYKRVDRHFNIVNLILVAAIVSMIVGILVGAAPKGDRTVTQVHNDLPITKLNPADLELPDPPLLPPAVEYQFEDQGNVIQVRKMVPPAPLLPPGSQNDDLSVSTLEYTEVLPTEVVEPEEEPEPEPEPEPVFDTGPQEYMFAHLGEDVIDTGKGILTRYELPSYYYPGIDFSSFQSWMPYDVITNRRSAAYKVTHSDRFYVDTNGLCRYWTYSEDEFTIDRHDDYVIALGTYYKPKGTCGDRWLIVTTKGAFTCITGDEKADADTDEHNMFTTGDGYCGFIEYLVDYSRLTKSIKTSGTVTKGPVEVLQGDILYIYRID